MSEPDKPKIVPRQYDTPEAAIEDIASRMAGGERVTVNIVMAEYRRTKNCAQRWVRLAQHRVEDEKLALDNVLDLPKRRKEVVTRQWQRLRRLELAADNALRRNRANDALKLIEGVNKVWTAIEKTVQIGKSEGTIEPPGDPDEVAL